VIAPSSLVFWDVDTQVDFIAPEGKFYVAGAEKIIPNIQRLAAWAQSHHVQIISSMDAHLPTDAEFQEYPPHCLVGTPGQKKIAGATLPNHLVIPNRPIDLPDLSAADQVIVEKQTLDVFANPNTENLVAQLAAGKEIILYGVVTELCVDKVARALIKRRYRVHVVTDAIQHLNDAAGQATVDNILKNGGRVLTTREIVD
jgi:nicotinamidase/pyrazinamidase